MSMIGKSAMASIRLKGLFAPKSAALISKRENKYFIAPDHKVKLRINGEQVLSQRELAPGDVIEIGKMKAAFSFQD
jgi:pSer/pThr/pTyr-binding forkhead associated (FHA) protein